MPAALERYPCPLAFSHSQVRGQTDAGRAPATDRTGKTIGERFPDSSRQGGVITSGKTTKVVHPPSFFFLSLSRLLFSFPVPKIITISEPIRP